MKKTAIVSCYFQHNYGSMLQAYATQKALDRLGYANETICVSGFYPRLRWRKGLYFVKAALTTDILRYKFPMALTRLRRKLDKGAFGKNTKRRDAAFSAFCAERFRLSPAYPSLKALGSCCEDNYSAVLVGSDQLWLPANLAAGYYTLQFVPDTVNTVAYATSFGQGTLPRDARKRARAFLLKIRHLSLREVSGRALAKELTGREARVVCDPTLLFTGEEWLDIQQAGPMIQGKYIFCYFLGNDPAHRDFARRLRGQIGCKIVALLHLDAYSKDDEGYADETPYAVGPGEFLNLIRHAAYVCTDSYHGTIFSILYRKDFFTFPRYPGHAAASTNGRLDTLFAELGIRGRCLTGGEPVSDCLERTLDYEAIHGRLETLRREGYAYLRNALGEVQA